MPTRRQFLQQSALLSTGLMMNPTNIFEKPRKTAVGIQLYSLREEIEKDTKGVITRVAATGYKEVETYGLPLDGKLFGMPIKDFAKLLQQNKLTSPSGHYLPEKMLFENGDGDDVKILCEVANTIGHKYIVIPWMKEERRKTIDQYKKLADRINAAGEICKKANVQLAYHNHDFEFIQMEGATGYDVIMNNTEKDLVKLELDLYWVVKAGLNPVDLFKKQPGRFHMWHVKDMYKMDNTKNTEVGNGSINFKDIFAHAKLSGVKHYYVEQENNYVPNTAVSIQTSINYIKKNLLK
jgi:sugar phosphate isomerase/epimerase